MLSAAAYIPQFLISFFAGVWADRYPRKRLIIAADGVIALATLALVLLLPQISQNETIYVALVVISAIRSLGTGVHTPAGNATVPQLVAEEHLMKFNGINATVQSVVQFAAPAIAGSILTWGSFRGALMLDVVTAMVGIGLLADRTSMRLLMVLSGGLLILMAAVMFLDKSFYRHGSGS